MKLEITIKDITLNDLDIFLNFFSNILHSSFPEYSSKTMEFFVTKVWNKEKYAKKIEKKEGYVYGAFYNDQLVGILDADKPFGGVSWCSWLMIDCNFTGKGIGTALITKWQEAVLKDKGHGLFLGADKRNFEYYKKIGFKHIGTMERGWFGHNEYMCAKILQEPKEENFLR